MTLTSVHSPNAEHQDDRPAIICIAGFGDNSTMFANLKDTKLAKQYNLHMVDMPGFGAPKFADEANLANQAEYVDGTAKKYGAHIIIAHSVASIIASIAAQAPYNQISTIISLEGNITADDAYFSGTAIDYDRPAEFKSAFLERLDEMAKSKPEIVRYRNEVAKADAMALWQLGCDARLFSANNVPGELLAKAEKACYIYNPDNCPATTLAWLHSHPMERTIITGATQWVSVDQPDMLSKNILQALA